MAGLRRGDIHQVRFGRAAGRAQAGARPAVILQADALSPLSTVVVAPMSRSAAAGHVRPIVAMGGADSTVMTDQITAVDVTRVGKRLGRVDADEAVELDRAIRLVLGLR